NLAVPEDVDPGAAGNRAQSGRCTVRLSETALLQLGRTARRAAGPSGPGAAVMFASLALSTLALKNQVNAKRTLVAALETQRRDLTDAVAQLNDRRAHAEPQRAG